MTIPVTQIGSRVQLKFANGDLKIFEIIDSPGAAPERGTIYFQTPLARAILGRRVGDMVTYMVNNVSFLVTIVTIKLSLTMPKENERSFKIE